MDELMDELDGIGFQEALELLSAEERFRSTVASMNALLIAKGVYSTDEFESYFMQSAKATIRKKQPSQRSGYEH